MGQWVVGGRVNCQPPRVVQMVAPLGCGWGVKLACLARWWCRHRLCRLASLVLPWGQGMRWSVSVLLAGRWHSGNVQVMSRAWTSRRSRSGIR